MTKIIACSELRYRTLAELEALFRTLQIELGRTAPGSRGARHRACQPRQRPPRYGGAPRPASEAVSASALVGAGSREHTAAASGFGFKSARPGQV